MGCSGSKEQDLPLVVRCRERRELIRAASNYRYALAAAHVSYFRSLKDVGDALTRFVDEELITTSLSSSVSSPSLILPPSSKKKNINADELHLHHNEDEDESHLHLTDSDDDDGDSEDFKYRHRNHHALDSDDGTHQHHGRHSHEHKGKVFHDEVRNLHEDESSFHYPRGSINGNGYSQNFADGLINDPFVYPYTNSYPPRSFGEPHMDQWEQPGVRQTVQPWYYSTNSNVYYMNKSAPEIKTVIQDPAPQPVYGYSDSYWNSPAGYGNAGYGGNYGYFSWGSPAGTRNSNGVKVSPQKEAPPPPSPKASGWDFFNPFDVSDNGYPGYYSSGRYGYGSNNSSPDSNELREREGIPDLEEDTEIEVSKEFLKAKKMKAESKKSSGSSIPRSRAVPVRQNSDSQSVPLHKSEGSFRSVHSWSSEESEKSSMPSRYSGDSATQPMPPPFVKERLKQLMSPPFKKGSPWVDQSSSVSLSLTDGKSSAETLVSKSIDESSVKKKGVSFEVEGTSTQDADSSKLSSVTLLPPHGTRDLQEVVAEIRDDFEIASSYGKEVAMMLEVGKLPHQQGFLKVFIYRMLCHIVPSLSSRDPSLVQSVKLASRTTKLAKSQFEDVGKDLNGNACNLSSTLDKLYAWEKKLYKEVKDEERLRVMYEKQCKRLKILDEGGADSSKLDAAQTSIRKLLTKLDVSVKAIDAISSRIHKLRDEELQPQVAALIHGLIRMWKAMLKCHQKQFQAIMESKMRKLKANPFLPTDSNSRASTDLKRELSLWCDHFIDWIGFQKSYVQSLNGWLLQCLQYEPEETPDGPVPYSPGQLGAPPIFIICNDWHQAMEAISEARVANAMNTFATSLRQLGEKQEEEGRQRLKAEHLSEDYERHLRTHHVDRGKSEREHDVMSDKTGRSLVPSDSGVSPLDDLKMDLDSMRRRLAEERIKHKDAMKLVHDAASSSLQGGLVPIFKALENFTLEALKLHEHVRVKHPGPS